MSLADALRRPTAILAEDEPLLADELADLLGRLWPQLQIVERAEDGIGALHAVEAHRPDLAFLDIRMPLLTGLDVARQIAGRCHVALITAFDNHALEAFEAGAVDYVLKPFSAARLMVTVQRLKARLERPPVDLSARAAGEAPRPSEAPRYLQWINASRGAAVRIITTDGVLYFKADSKYTMVVTADAEALIKKTIKELAEELDPLVFWQVHRSTIVNVHAIDSVRRDDRGNLFLRLKQRAEMLPVSEAYAPRFRQM
jgi:DNA-binding LytR/AlgR family response regulator